LWALCLYDLRLSEEQFLQLTLKELDALCKRKKLVDKKSEVLLAQIACMYHNVHRDENESAKEIEDFMITKTETVKREQSPEEMKNIAKLITAAFGGEVK
jgi:hypothetical protein